MCVTIVKYSRKQEIKTRNLFFFSFVQNVVKDDPHKMQNNVTVIEC